MESDIETTSETTISKNLTLDLNGKTLNVGANYIVIDGGSLTVEDTDSDKKGTISGTNSSPQSALIKVGYSQNAGTFTLNSGNITITTSNNPAVGVNASNSTVNIEGGKITAPNKGIGFLRSSNSTSTVNIKGGEINVTGTGDQVFAVHDDGGSKSSNIINIEGGTIISNGSNAVSSKNNGQVTVSGGTITSASENFKKNGNKASFTVTGGVFSSDVSAYISADVESAFVGDKLYVGNDYENIKDSLSSYTQVTIDGETKYYSDSSQIPVVPVTLTKSDGTTSGGYTTLEKAIEAADDGSTITLNKDITLSAQLILTKKITLDLKGQTITATNTITISDGGELTLKDDSEGKTGKLSSNVMGNFIIVYGKFTMESGTVTNSNRAAISNSTSGTLTINGGTITGNQHAINNEGTAVVNNGTIETTSTNASYYGINNNNSGTLTINNGTVKSSNSHGISNSGTLTVSGGTIETTSTNASHYGINNTGNSLTVTGGTVKGTTAIGTSTGTLTISGGAIEGTTNSLSISGSATAEISGGTFTGAINNTNTSLSKFITGGVFNTNPATDTDYLAEGLSVAQIGENYVVGSQTWYLKDSTSDWTNGAKPDDPLATMTLSDKTLTLGNKSGATDIVPLDISKAVANNTEFTTLDASAATTALNITGDSVVKLIKGGSGNDTLTAGANGASLEGNGGNDFLIGGDGKDYFFYSGGSDSIDNYDSASDVVSLKSGTAPTTFDKVKYDGSDYIISLGSGTDSLTFKAKNSLSLVKDGETFYYAHDRIIFDDKAITLGAAYGSKSFNVNKIDGYEGIASINAADVTVNGGLTVNGNEDTANKIIGATSGGKLIGKDRNDTLQATDGKTTLDGGDGSNSLIGGNGADVFVYTGGADSISGFDTGDLVSVKTSQDISFKESTVTSDDDNVTLNFGGDNKLVFEAVDDAKAISLRSGKSLYTLTKQSIALDKSITLTADYASSIFSQDDAYNTIDAAAVGRAISIVGNNNGNYILGSASFANSLTGGTGNDTFTGGTAADVFFYDGGKDIIQNFDENDKLSIDTDAITEGKAGNRKLTFTLDKNDVLTFKADDTVPAQISLESGGYLTKDGVVGDKSLTLFTNARGTIDLTDELYSGANISLVSAENAAKQSVTLVGGSQGGAFTFAANKKRDVFEYGGGAVSISGYEAGKDRINLGDDAISAFSINGGDVLLTLAGDDENIISLKGAKGSEVFIHQATNKGKSYSKMAFAETGVLYDRTASKATSATLQANAGDYTTDGSIKKVTVSSGVAGIAITANDKANTIINASAAGGVSLISGAKNDKFTGSSNADMFVYTGGKDIFQSFGEADSISLGNNLNTAKITSSKKAIKFKFGSKDVLTIKPTKGDTLSGELTINGAARTYGKNSIADGGSVSLTSEFGGTYKVAGDINHVDGHLVKKKLTIKGTTAAESLIGGIGKTMFKGAGGNDTLQGGDGDDTFFYARGDKDTVTIANFDFTKDKLKIASGTIAKVSSISGGVQFAMKNGRGDSPEVGWFNVTTDAKNVLIKTNNTYYWFAEGTETLASDDTLTATEGALITSTSKINKSQVSGYAVIDLNYSTNLIKSEVAVQVKDTLKAAT